MYHCLDVPQNCRFVPDSRVEVPWVVGKVGYSSFDSDSFENKNWRGKGLLGQSSKISICGSGKGMRVNDRLRFFNLKGVYPD